MNKLLKKIIRMAPGILAAFAAFILIIGLPGIFIYMEGLWVGLLNILAVILIVIAWVIFCGWLDDLGQWAKEDGK